MKPKSNFNLHDENLALLEPPTQEEILDLLEPPDETEIAAENLEMRLARCGKCWVMYPKLEQRGWKFAHYKCGHRLLCQRCGNEYAVRIASGILTKVRSRQFKKGKKLMLFELPNKTNADDLVSGLGKSHYFRSPVSNCEYVFVDPKELPLSKLTEFKNQYPHKYLTVAKLEKLDWSAITKTIEGRRPSGKLATVAVNNTSRTKINSRIIQTNAPLFVLEMATKTVEEKTKHILPTDAEELETAIIQISELVAKEILNRGIRAEKNWYATVGRINAFVDLDRLDWSVIE